MHGLSFTNCHIWVPENLRTTPNPTALLSLNNKILLVGTDEEVSVRAKLLLASCTSLQLSCINGGGRLFLTPGLFDSHVHFLDGGRSLCGLTFSDCFSKESFQNKLASYIRKELMKGNTTNDDNKNSSGREMIWILGGNWNEEQLGAYPNKLWIDEVVNSLQLPQHVDILVMLHRLDYHSVVCNSGALSHCGITSETQSPPGGEIVRVWRNEDVTNSNSSDGSWDLTGIVKETAISLLAKKIIVNTQQRNRGSHIDTEKEVPFSSKGEEAMTAAAEAATNYLLSNGITCAFSMTSLLFSNIEEIQFLRRFEQRGKMRIRLRLAVRHHEIKELQRIFDEYKNQQDIVDGTSTTDTEDNGKVVLDVRSKELGCTSTSRTSTVLSLHNNTFHSFGSPFIRLGALKIFADGSLGSRTAAMVEPYCDSPQLQEKRNLDWNVPDQEVPNNCACGLLLHPVGDLHEMILNGIQVGLQVCVHGIGDRAVKHIIDGFEQAACGSNRPSHGTFVQDQNLRHRIEHCQHIHDLGELRRMSQLNLIASVQPCHLLFDGDYVDQRIGAERKRFAYPFRSMIQAGVLVAFGSDWMVAPADVRNSFLAAVTRQPISVKENKKIFPKQSSLVRVEKEEINDTPNNATTVDPSLEDEATTVRLPLWSPSEALSVEECLLSLTQRAAVASFMDEVVGQLRVGWLADITVFSASLLDGAGGYNKSSHVVMTVVDGIVRYSSLDPRRISSMQRSSL